MEPDGSEAAGGVAEKPVNGQYRPDLKSYLEPIPGEDPAGRSVRYENVYDEIKEARRADDPALPQGVWETELKRADWKEVDELCTRVLKEESKDIQVAAWLTEAWLHRYGFSGFAAGLELMHSLSEVYWEGLYPRIEEEDIEFRVGPYAWLNDRLSVEAKLLPITHPTTSDARAYCMNDRERGDQLDNLSRRDGHAADQAEAGGAVTREMFLTSVALTAGDFYVRLWKDSSRAYSAAEELDEFLDEQAGNAAPGLGRLKDALKDVMLFAQRTMAEKGETPRFDDDDDDEDDDADFGGHGFALDEDMEDDMASGDGPITSRAQAYRMLDQAADYLLRAEPHSPAPYLVKRAVTWGRMPLQDLLTELLQDGTDRFQLYKLLGMKLPRGDD
jgi:type VI secretion system ImpA family protein